MSNQNQNRELEITDDEFIARFAALSSEQTGANQVVISQGGLNSRNWALTAMVRIVTDKLIIENNFATNMRRIWAAHADTEISPIAKNVFLVQFQNKKDIQHVMRRGIWLYRSEAVIARRVSGPADMANTTVTEMEVCVQFHRIPPGILSHEGIMQLANRLGTPMSEVTEAFTGHTSYYKVKYMLPVDEPLTDTLKGINPMLGTFPVYLSYERIPKVCLFCAYIGHEHDTCLDKQRMERLMVDARYRNNPEMKKLTKPTLGPWINDPSLIPPIPQIEVHDTGSNSGHTEQNQDETEGPQNEYMHETVPNATTENRPTESTEPNRNSPTPCEHSLVIPNCNGPDLNQINPEMIFQSQPETPMLALAGMKRNSRNEGFQSLEYEDMARHISHSKPRTGMRGDTNNMQVRKKRIVEPSKNSSPPHI